MSMDTFLFIITIALGVHWFYHYSKLKEYLKIHQPEYWEKIQFKKYLGIPSINLPHLEGGLFKELRFAFNRENLNDHAILRLKRNWKISFILFIISIIAAISYTKFSF
jgi:hypothetical protein